MSSGKRFAHLIPARSLSTHIFIIKVPEGKTAKNRCHIDFEFDWMTVWRKSNLVALCKSAGATNWLPITHFCTQWVHMDRHAGPRGI